MKGLFTPKLINTKKQIKNSKGQEESHKSCTCLKC